MRRTFGLRKVEVVKMEIKTRLRHFLWKGFSKVLQIHDPNPKPATCNLQLATKTCNLQHATFNLPPKLETCKMQLLTCNQIPKPATCNLQLATKTCNLQPATKTCDFQLATQTQNLQNKKPPKLAYFRGPALIYQDWFTVNDPQILRGPHPFLWPYWPALKIR
jgi:hypothetical protein